MPEKAFFLRTSELDQKILERPILDFQIISTGAPVVFPHEIMPTERVLGFITPEVPAASYMVIAVRGRMVELLRNPDIREPLPQHS
jgi:hypothetical protein